MRRADRATGAPGSGRFPLKVGGGVPMHIRMRSSSSPRRRSSGALAVLAAVAALLAAPAVTRSAPGLAAPLTPSFGPYIDAYQPYEGQSTCDPTPKPGALDLRDIIAKAYPGSPLAQISRDCSVGGSSEHKEGRALDWMRNADVPSEKAQADDFIAWLLATDSHGNRHAMARRLGVMYIIWNKQMWRAYRASEGWQPYTGWSPHTDHVHISMGWPGAQRRTTWWTRYQAPAPGSGHWMATSTGTVLGLAAPDHGSVTFRLNQPIVDMAARPTGDGYWLVAPDGGIFPFGAAPGYGSLGHMRLNKPIVGIAATPSGKGYWLVASDGGIFPFGDAPGIGSLGHMRLNKPIVGIAATPSGKGYWLVASDGGIFPFGDAPGIGSLGHMPLNQPVVAMAATRTGRGYWLIARDGGVFPFGDAAGYGSTGNIRLNSPIVDLVVSADDRGYVLVAGDGGVFPFGNAVTHGSAAGWATSPVVGVARYR